MTNQARNPADLSGVVVAADTAQNIAPENLNRSGFWIQNLGGSNLWLDFGQNAVAGKPSIKIPGDALYESPANGVQTGRISIISSVDGAEFSAREW